MCYSEVLFGSSIPWLLSAPIVTALSWCAAAVLCSYEDASLQDDKYNDFSLPLLQVATGATMGVVAVNLFWTMVMGVETLCHKRHLAPNKQEEKRADDTHDESSPEIIEDEDEIKRYKRQKPKPSFVANLKLENVKPSFNLQPETLTGRGKRVDGIERKRKLYRKAGIESMTSEHDYDYDKARSALEYACELGDEIAWCYLGLLYEYGLGVEVSLHAAAYFYGKSKAVHPWTNLVQAVCYLRRLEIDKLIFLEDAVKMLIESVSLSASCMLKHWESTINFLDRIANTPMNVSANLILALVYELGLLRVNRNAARAVQYYEKVAEQGESWTQYNLGMLYQNKKWLYRNDETAYKWLRSSVDKRHKVLAFNKI